MVWTVGFWEIGKSKQMASKELQMSNFCPLKGLIYFNTKLKILERRHQRIREMKAKHELLKEELEETKCRLMLDPSKWKGECKYLFSANSQSA